MKDIQFSSTMPAPRRGRIASATGRLSYFEQTALGLSSILFSHMANPSTAKIVNIFIRCRNCGVDNPFPEIPLRRIDLALFRGSEERIVKCPACYADMNKVTAFVGKKVGSEIVRQKDPQ
jgi:hypothetical protein